MSFSKYLVRGLVVAVTLVGAADASYTGTGPLQVTDSAGDNFASVVAAIVANSISSLQIYGFTSTDGSTTITTGGTAQNLFSAAIPSHGFEVCNPGTTDDLWVSDSTTAAANNTGSYRVAANGGCYVTPIGRRPIQAISIVGATTGDKITARSY